MSNSRIKIDRKRNARSDQDFFTQFEDSQSQNDFEKKENSKKEYTRQTFLIDKEQLNKLKDFVHTKRLKVDYSYTQKRAVSEALELLFASVDEIEKRDTK
jgi:hypothetical protein